MTSAQTAAGGDRIDRMAAAVSRREQAAERAAIADVLGDHLMTVAVLAKELGQSEGHVRKLLESGAIPGARKVTDGRAVRKSWRVSSLALAEWQLRPGVWWWEYRDEYSARHWNERARQPSLALLRASRALDMQGAPGTALTNQLSPDLGIYEELLALAKLRDPELVRGRADWRLYKVLAEPLKRQSWQGTLEKSPDLLTIRVIHGREWTGTGRVHWVRSSVQLDGVCNWRVSEITPWPAVESVEAPNYGDGPLELSARAIPADVRRARTDYREHTDEQLRQLTRANY